MVFSSSKSVPEQTNMKLLTGIFVRELTDCFSSRTVIEEWVSRINVPEAVSLMITLNVGAAMNISYNLCKGKETRGMYRKRGRELIILSA